MEHTSASVVIGTSFIAQASKLLTAVPSINTQPPRAQDHGAPRSRMAHLRFLLLGIGLGITFSVVLYLGITLGQYHNLLAVFGGLTLCIGIGALAGYLGFSSRYQRAQSIHTELSALMSAWSAAQSAQLRARLNGADADLDQATQATKAAIDGSLPFLSRILGLFASLQMLGWIAGLLAACGSVAIFSVTYMQVQRLDAQIVLVKEQNSLFNTQNLLSEAERRAALQMELTSVLDATDTHLQQISASVVRGPVRLPKRLLGRIVALTRALEPYRTVDDDGRTTTNSHSPERGHLLLALSISGVDLAPLNELGADFTEAALDNLNFDKLLLENASLNGASLRNLRARDGNFKDSDLSNADFSDAAFENAVLVGANARGTIFDKAEFRRADLSGINASGGQFVRTNFAYVDATNANFAGANLMGAGLAGGRFVDATFTGANLQEATFRKSVLGQATQFSDANVAGVDFHGSTVQSADWIDEMGASAVGFDSASWEILPHASGVPDTFVVLAIHDEND